MHSRIIFIDFIFVAVHAKTVIIIGGPTASGKTNLAIRLAKHFKTQIISADSRQCFKEMQIGVAKPSAEQLNSVHHYFINSHSIHDTVNAAVFETYALRAAEEIFKQNDVAIMVGGTGLYIKAFCEGLDEMPQIPDAIREEIINQYQTLGLEWLQQQVSEKDPDFWKIAEQQNPQRLMRALELLIYTGQPLAALRKGKSQQRDFNIIKFAISLSREALYNHINQRVDVMIREGLVDEVASLLPHRNVNALQTVGYKEIFDYMDGLISLDKAIEEIKKNTRHYAKRQITWFKKDALFQWKTAEQIFAEATSI